jgi:type IV/VI secretion system ImpK/VasF family protein
MTADSYSASLVSRFTVPEKNSALQGYYRSKLFIVSSDTNPLIAAAGPLFSLLDRLGISQNLPPIDEIRSKMEHEVNAFNSRLLKQEYADDLTVIARYIMCATIDELLGKNYLRIHNEPAEFKSFIPPSNDDTGSEKRFFEIIDYIKERANQYLDLLELVYYCLIVGFEGEQHLKPDGRQTLDNLIEELYHLIQEHRVHKPLRLFKQQNEPVIEPSKNWSVITNGLLAIGVVTVIYLSSHIILDNKAKNVLQGHTILAVVEN